MQFHRVHVVRRMPHPGNGFTQGLIAEWDGQAGRSVWESTGQYGQSTLRRYELGAGVPAAQAELPAEFFGEGICRVGDAIWQLTWRERIALSWDAETLEPREVVHVRYGGQRVLGLNDLTWAGGLVWANVAGTDALAGIDLASGEITDVVDARAAAERHWGDPQAIMNGIAALAAPGEFLLTGKEWKSIRQVRLEAERDRGHIARLLAGFAR